MIDQAKRLREIFGAELKKLALGDTVGYAVDGPQYVPSPQGITMGWVIMVSLKHNMLIGQPDIGVGCPVMGVLPPDEVFRKGAEYILDEARKLRQEANNPSEPPHVEQAAEQAQAGLIPPGLQGLAGQVSQRPPG